MDSRRRFYTIAGAIVLLVAVVTAYMTKEFVTTIILSIFLAYILRPMYSQLLRFTGRKSLSSFLSILAIFIAFTYLLFSVIGVLSFEVSSLLSSNDLTSIRASNMTKTFDVSEVDISLGINSFISKYMPSPLAEATSGFLLKFIPSSASVLLDKIGLLLAEAVNRFLPVFSHTISSLVSQLPENFARFVVAIFFTYYILIDGGYFVSKALDLVPERNVVTHFVGELHAIYNTLFSVYFVTSMLSGVIAAVGFFILGIPYPVLWGAIIAIFTMVPLLGPTVVYVPMAIYYALMQNYFMAMALMIFGTVFMMVIPENVLRPRLAMQSAKIHPIITLLAYTAPLFVVGLIGVIIGPALYGFLLASYRTILYLKRQRAESDAGTSAPEPSTTSMLQVQDIGPSL